MSAILWLVLTLAGLQGRPPDKGSIEGVVIRAGALAGNAAISNVRVAVRGTAIFDITDRNGEFILRNVDPGRYSLTVSRDGFVIQDDAPHNLTQSGLAVTLTRGQALNNIVIPMIPAPVISGRVYDPLGAPLAAAVVQAYARRYTPDGPRLKSVKKTMTDDLGEYRLFWLGFGEYIMGAGYSDSLRRGALGGVDLSANVSKADDGYTTAFYGGAATAALGDTVRLAPAVDPGNVNIVLSDAPRFRISGRVVSSALPPEIRIIAAADGNDLDLDSDYSFLADPGGGFQIDGLSPGQYVILATGEGMSSNLVPVSVTDRNVDGLAIPMYSTVSLAGRVSIENRPTGVRPGSASPPMKVTLVRSALAVDQKIEASTASDGTFTVTGVGPGDYDVLVNSLPEGTYVSSIRLARRESITDRMRVDPGATGPFEIVLGSGAAVSGSAAGKDGQPAPGAQVVLIPEVRYRRRTDRYITIFTDATGRFQMSGVPPGRYTAYAFEQIPSESYFAFAYSQEANRRFADRGAALAVTATGGPALQLTVIPVSETAGGLQ